MICKNCGAEFQDNLICCPNCGTYVQQNNEYQQGNPFQYNDPAASANFGNYNYGGYYPPVQENKPVSMGTYLGWMLLSFIFGPISLVISIVFACMTENKNRSNFFKAQLVMWGIGIALSIIFAIVFAIFGFSMMASADPEAFEYFYYDQFLNIASLFKF